MPEVYLYDTTLRDGSQGENINFTAEDKLKIARKLDSFGVHYIEGGWPGSNPKDTIFFEQAKKIDFKNSKLTAFGATRRPGQSVENDPSLQAILKSEAPAVTLFGKTWDLHVEKIMNNTLEENLRMIKESVSYFRGNGREIIYDAEHFFDGYKENRDYALKTLGAAFEGGAEFLVLCDTNGGTLPYEVGDAVLDVKDYFNNKYGSCENFRIGIHAHNDSGLAVANSIEAVRKGAVMVQGTVNGYGERCGNADITSVIPVLAVKMGIDCISPENLKRIKNVSRYVSETANVPPLNNRPFVGKSAFAHKGGVHVSAVQKDARAYEHMLPELVGNERRVIVSDYSGKSNIEYKAKELGIDLEKAEVDSKDIVEAIKNLEQSGYQFEAAEASFRILMEKLTGDFKLPFELISFRVTIEKDLARLCSSHAMIKISVDGTETITAAEGHGPVSALDNALRKALSSFFESIKGMHLVDFKVRVLDGSGGTESKVRVLIESRDEDNIWTTIGVSEDIIEASWQALADSFYYKLGILEAKNKDFKNEQ
ncbi:MAG: citramalate synthase [Deltaproteobacteria bacterium]|nr:MAG: citramalate synthase [Deltaproteobacteria bacterium]PIE74706.1 MAG: citramalate synthase [Deltaproteobacteria bacterium]